MTDPCIERLRAFKPQFAAMHIKRVRVFGSRLRGAARPDSDLDLLIEFDRRPDLLELGDVYTRLEEVVGCPIDIVQPHKIIPALQQEILGSAQDV